MQSQGTWKGARIGHASILRADRELEWLLLCGARNFSFNRLVWYIDGSGLSGRARARVWAEGPAIAKAIVLDSHATVLQTQRAALRTCARTILEKGDKGKKIFIYSDSRRALRAILKYEYCSKLSGKCVELMEEIAVHNRLEVAWIPSDAGIRGNEKADELAKHGCRKASQGEWSAWGSETGARHAKSLLKRPTRKIAEALLGLNRAKLRAIVGLITGHWPLALYLSSIGKRPDPLCKSCGEKEEDPFHLCTRCSGLDAVRWDVFGSACTEIHVDRDGIKGLYELARRAQILETSG
ncbi:uncharacterized protein LOC135171581 [Diachasmimorpha longicaudata]|uniref:uncharacterized protein LOC135171581 n=1 Tax=Diachasmimorpha longicaudata TaxID=58733 RepID=UPI0030B8D227